MEARAGVLPQSEAAPLGAPLRRKMISGREAFARSKADADGSSETGRSPPAYSSAGTSSGTMISPSLQCTPSAPLVTKYFAPFEGVT